VHIGVIFFNVDNVVYTFTEEQTGLKLCVYNVGQFETMVSRGWGIGETLNGTVGENCVNVDMLVLVRLWQSLLVVRLLTCTVKNFVSEMCQKRQ